MAATGAYNHADALTRSDAGADATAAQALLLQGSGSLNPFRGPLDLPPRPADEARSRLDTTNLSLSASGPAFRAPGGSAYASLALQETGAWLASDSLRRGQSQSSRRGRNDIGARASLDFPIARGGPAGPLGDLWLNANAGADQVSDFGTLAAVGYGLNWSPRAGLNLIVSRTDAETAPTLQQVGDPVAVADRAYMLDYVTGQAVDVRRIAGGDPGLVAERRKSLKVGVTFAPPVIQNLTLSATYLDTRIDNPIGVFPVATTAIQQAFQGRFVRDATGRLVEVDVSPVNFGWERSRELRWGVNYVRRVGAVPDSGRALLSTRAAQGLGQDPSAGAHAHHYPRGGAASLQGTSLQIALYHTVYFQDLLALRPGGAPLDLLGGGAASALGGQPRHEIEAQAGLVRNGLGARLSADWRSATSIRDAAPAAFESLTFAQAPQLSLRLFANLDGDPDLVRRHPVLRGARFTVSVSDLFDSRVRVRNALGATPLSYQPAYLEPAGRVVRISFRKLLQ